jgi:CBS domain-containing protein
MRAIDAVRRQPVTVTADETFQAVAKAMAQRGVGAVVVVDDAGAPVGVVTDRDLVVRALANGAVDGRVDSVMSTDVLRLDADDDLRDVIRAFGSRAVRRAVLVRGGAVAGVLSVDDLLIDLVADLGEVVRPVAAEVLFGHRDASVPATRECELLPHADAVRRR